MARNILIIDDDESFKALLEIRLRSFFEDSEFFTCRTLKEARSFLKDNTIEFDLVILDQHLPDGLGNEFLKEGWFRNLAVLSVSSDTAPNIPGESLQAGARFFLDKIQVSEPLFKPLVKGIMQRNELQRELNAAQLERVKIDTVKRLINTLKHEINNPLGAVFGGAYLIENSSDTSEEQKKAARLVKDSGERIKNVLEQLSDAVELQSLNKSNSEVFHIPGDKEWK